MAIDVGSAIAYLDLDTSKFRSGLNSALSSLNTFADSSLSASTRITALGSAVSTTGSTLTKTVTLPLAAAGTAATKLASDFEASMSKVEAISGSTSDEMVDLRNKAIEMGAKTKFSAKESADAFTYMAMAGWKAEQMIDGIGGIMSLAAADGLDLATTSDIVTDALTAFGLKAEDSAHFADVLAQASSSANTNVAMLGESFKYAASVAGSMGVSVEDTALALGIMANSGIKSSMAGTALRSVLTRLATDAGASSEKLGALGVLTEELGVQFYDSEGNVRDFSDVLVETREAWKGLNEEQQTNYAKTIAGQYALSGFLALMNTEEEEFNKLANAIENSDGRADEMAATMMDNLAGAIEQLLGALESLAIKFGTALTPTIRSVAEWLTVLVEKLNTLSDEQVEQIVKIAAMVAAFGPLLIILGKVITSIGSIVQITSSLPAIGASLTAISSALLPIVAITGTVIGLIAVFKKLYEENENFRERVTEVWNNVRESISMTVENIKTTFKNLKEGLSGVSVLLQETFDKISPELGDSTIRLLESIQVAFEKLQPIVENVAEVFGGILLTAISALVGIINGLLKALSPLIDLVSSSISFFVSLGEAIASLFSGDYQGFVQHLNEAFESVKVGVTSLVETIVALITGFFEGFWKTLKSLFLQFGVDVEQFITDTWNSIVEFFVGIKDSIVEFIEGVREELVKFITVTIPEFVGTIREWINNLPYYFGYVIGLVIGHITSFGEKLISFVITDIPKFINKIVENLKTLPEKFKTWLDETIKKVNEWANTLKNKATEVGRNLVNTLVNFLKELPGKFSSWFNSVIQTISNFASSMTQAGKNLINSLWRGLKDAWSSVLDWFDGVGRKISSFFSGIADGFNSAKASAESLQKKVSGSHANGLSYVPYNGYIAELHEGERVLTKSENEQYNNGRSGGDTYIFNSPKQIDEYEAIRLFKKTKQEYEWA